MPDDSIPHAPGQSPTDRLHAEIEALGQSITKLIDKFGDGNAAAALVNVGQAAGTAARSETRTRGKKPSRIDVLRQKEEDFGRLPPDEDRELGDLERREKAKARNAASVAPDATREPPRPPGGSPPSVPPSPPATPDHTPPSERDDRSILEAINRGVWQLVRQAAEQGKAKGTPTAQAQPGPFQAALDALGHTKVGGIVKRLYQRVAPHARSLRGTLGGKRGKGSARPGGKSAPPIMGRPVAPRPPGAPALPTAVPVGAPGAGAAAGAGEGAAAAGAVEAGAAAGPVGLIIAGGVALTLALVEAAKAGVDFAYGMEQNARKLAEVSPSQAANVTQLDIGRTRRAIDTGESTAGSSQKLTEAIDRFEAATQPIEKLLTTLANTFGAVFLELLSDGAEKMNTMIELFKIMNPIAARALENMENNRKGEAVFFGDWVKKVAADQDRKEREAKEAIERIRRAQAGF